MPFSLILMLCILLARCSNLRIIVRYVQNCLIFEMFLIFCAFPFLNVVIFVVVLCGI